MTVTILLLILGAALVILGADFLVDGASAIARKFGVSEFVIGLTIVGFGTSCPELVVSLKGALMGNADIAIGNVVGSNIFNVALILGLTSLVSPLKMTELNRKRDIPACLLVSFVLVFCGMSSSIFGISEADGLGRVSGIFFILLFAAYIYMCFKGNPSQGASPEKPSREIRPVLAVGMIVAGLAGLVFGGELFVDSAVDIARKAGVSDKFIAVTLLAGGTSLPELATCIVAAFKGKDQLALGNVLGSNVFNILLILGLSSLVTPLSFAGLNIIDFGAMILSVILLWCFTYTGGKNILDRWEGALLLAVETAYISWLFCSL